MIFVGILLLIVAAICFFFSRSQSSKLREMSATDTYTAQLVKDLHTRVVGSLGAEALAQPCEVEGVIECNVPLQGPLSGTACVAYTHAVTRQYEEDVTTTDSQGKTERNTRRGSETISNEDRHTSFWVRDATGLILVNPEGAELDLIETANRFEQEPNPGRNRRRTLGQTLTEQSLPVGTKVYILGCAVDQDGQPVIARNPRNTTQFLISRKTERELSKSAETWSRNLSYAAMGSGALGLVLLVFGLIG